MTDQDRAEIQSKLSAALSRNDWRSASALLTHDASWILAGGIIVFEGCKQPRVVAAVAQAFLGSGNNIALVCSLRQDKIARIETYFSDGSQTEVFCT